MKRIDNFSSEEWNGINLGKEKLIEVAPLKKHLEQLAAIERKEARKLESLGYTNPKLDLLKAEGIQQGWPSLYMCRLIDALRAIKEEISATEIKLNRIMNAIWKMPTKQYQDILLKKYVTNIVLSVNDRKLRQRYLDAACLEFFGIYYGRI